MPLADAGLIVESHSKQLRWAAGKLKDVSGINSEGWDAMKTATALRIMFDPEDTTDDDEEFFTEEELSTLEMTAHKYEDIIDEDISLKFYSDLVEMREVKKDALEVLAFWLGSIPCTDPSLANSGETILVLFETPSGFAIFCFKKDYLNQPNIFAIFGEHFRPKGIVWLKEFQIFKDKSSAIDNATGVSRELTEMILRYHHPCQKLAVGKPEYKTIIETSLPGVPCLFDETVMEVMWGLKNLMHSLVPQEKLNLTKEDRLPMSQGLKMFLYRYGFDVKPELVNREVLVAACLLRDSGLIVESHSKKLRWAAGKLKDVSGINSEGWDAMKIATALRIMFDPAETTDHDVEIFTEEELSTLEMTAHKYEDIINKDVSLKFYSDLVEMREVKKDALKVLALWLGSSV